MSKDTASQSQAVPSELAEYKRVREEFVIAARNNGAFCIDSAMINVDALTRTFSHNAATGKVPEGWISVLGAAPAQGEGVLVTDGTTVTAARWFSTGWATHGFDNGEVVYLPEGRVTHWKPFAASPAAPLAGKAEPNIPDLPLWHYNEQSKTIHPDPCGEWVRADTARHAILTSVLADRKARDTAPLAAAVPAEEASDDVALELCARWKARALKAEAALLAPAEPAPIQSSAEVVVVNGQIARRESIAENHDAMIILTQSYPRESVIRVVDAHTERNVAAALAAARLSKPTAQGAAEPASIDTPEFRKLLNDLCWASEIATKPEWETISANLIAHINRHIAAQATAGRDAQQWISVDERLPSDDCRVLAATWFTMDLGQHLDIVSFRSGSGQFSHSDVTHWMPLPTAPHAAEQASGGAK